MSANNFAMADQASESFPNYESKIHDHYIEGYEPVSLGAPHSSLERTSTWVGMGLVLAALAEAEAHAHHGRVKQALQAYGRQRVTKVRLELCTFPRPLLLLRRL